MATFHLICGLPGAGKTTLARRLESNEHALYLSPDPWMSRVVRDGYDAERREAVKALQLELAGRALALGVNVVSDAGFWSRRERDQARKVAAEASAQAKLHFLDVPIVELRRRLEQRNAGLPLDTFHVELSDLELWSSWFERPTEDELG